MAIKHGKFENLFQNPYRKSEGTGFSIAGFSNIILSRKYLSRQWLYCLRDYRDYQIMIIIIVINSFRCFVLQFLPFELIGNRTNMIILTYSHKRKQKQYQRSRSTHESGWAYDRLTCLSH